MQVVREREEPGTSCGEGRCGRVQVGTCDRWVKSEVPQWGQGILKETASQTLDSTETRTRDANSIVVSI